LKLPIKHQDKGNRRRVYCHKHTNKKAQKTKDEIMTEKNAFSISELQQKANAGDAQAQFDLAYRLSNDKNVDVELGLDWLIKAANQGHVEAQFATGLYYFLGNSSRVQSDRLSRLLNRWVMGLANHNRIELILDLPCNLATRHVPAFGDCNANLTATWFEKAASQGHVEANVWLGLLYRDGLGVQQSDELAFSCFKLALERGESPEAQCELARCYLKGKGTTQNTELGMHWCKMAAENGFAGAQHLLACCYFDGVGVAQNFEQGLAWLDKTEQNDASIIEDKIMMRLAEAYSKGTNVEQNDTLALHWLEKVVDASENDLLIGEACYQAATMYFDGKGSATDYEKGMQYLRDAINCNHAGAKQWLENAYMQFTFPEFIGRDDAVQCYQYAYNWLSKAITENPSDREVNFALGVLFAFGKGIDLNQDRAKEIFLNIHGGNGITYTHEREDDVQGFANIYCAIFQNWNNGFLYPSRSSGIYFTSKLQSREREVNKYMVMPSMVMDFCFEKRDFKLLRTYLDFLENAEGIFEQESMRKHLKKIIVKTTEQEEKLAEKNQELEAKNKQLQEAQKELEDMMSMFAHKFRSPLDAIIYNTTHENQAKLYAEAAQTMRGLLNIFSIISTDAEILKDKIKQDRLGNGRLATVFSKTLDMILVHLLSVSGAEKIQQHYMAYAKAHGQCDTKISYKTWCEDYFELEQALQAEWEQSFALLLNQSATLEQRLAWLEQHFFKLELIGFERDDIQFKEYGVTESLLTILLNEILVNAFKYYSSVSKQPVVLEWTERGGYQVLICRNPSVRSERTIIKGSHKGQAFLSTLARKTGSAFTKPTPKDDFVVEFGVPDELLISK
jgi:TPR repeat protein/signal transduction histidine kinase